MVESFDGGDGLVEAAAFCAKVGENFNDGRHGGGHRNNRLENSKACLQRLDCLDEGARALAVTCVTPFPHFGGKSMHIR